MTKLALRGFAIAAMSVVLSGCAARTPPTEYVESVGHPNQGVASRADAEVVGTERLDDQTKSLIAENRITDALRLVLERSNQVILDSFDCERSLIAEDSSLSPKSIIALDAKDSAYSALYTHVVEERPQRMDRRYIEDWVAAADQYGDTLLNPFGSVKQAFGCNNFDWFLRWAGENISLDDS